jgi:two-component system response regulator MprA/two-component system response regulator MtrA
MIELLVAEDDADSRVLLQTLLTQAGYRVRSVDDGQQAIDVLEAGFRPKAMLIDLMMPKVDGFRLIEYIRTKPAIRDVPRIVLTGVPRGQVRGITDQVFFKPFLPSEILAAIASVAGRP